MNADVVLVDTNVLLDLVTDDPNWSEWSLARLEEASLAGPVLINDIAAVKCFLDRKNDTGACNTSSTILLGAETGATLGAIWLNAEWRRYKVVQNPVNPLFTSVDPRPRAWTTSPASG